MQRVHLEAMSQVAQPAQLAVELAPPEWYRQAKTPTAVTSLPSWRTDPEGESRAAANAPLGSHVIELDLT